jgi:hypothetical protein
MKNSNNSLVVTLLSIIILILIVILVATNYSIFSAKNTTQTVTVSPSPVSVTQVRDNSDVSSGNASGNKIISTETAPPGPAPYLNVDNVNEQTGTTVISSPRYGDRYLLGGTVAVKWNPELIDVSTIIILSANDPKAPSFQIYRRLKLGDQVSKNAEFDYVIPNNLSIYPGQYRMKIMDFSEKHTYISDVFTIDSSVPLLSKETRPFSIKSIIGAEDAYNVGDIMELNVEALDGDGTAADNTKGFNIVASLYDMNNRNVWSDNGQYNLSTQTWHLSIPLIKNTYRVQVTLYCSLYTINSICAQKYNNSKQLDQYISFKLN